MAICEHAPNLIEHLENHSATARVLNSKEIQDLHNELSVLRGLRSSNPDIIQAINKIEATINTLSIPSRIIAGNSCENYKKKIIIASQVRFWESLNDKELQLVLAEFVERVEVDSEGGITPIFKLVLTQSSMGQ